MSVINSLIFNAVLVETKMKMFGCDIVYKQNNMKCFCSPLYIYM